MGVRDGVGLGDGVGGGVGLGDGVGLGVGVGLVLAATVNAFATVAAGFDLLLLALLQAIETEASATRSKDGRIRKARLRLMKRAAVVPF